MFFFLFEVKEDFNLFLREFQYVFISSFDELL